LRIGNAATKFTPIPSPGATSMRGAGGTPGGLGTFLSGAALVIAGGFLLLNQVTVTSGYWRLWGYNAFGLSLFPLLIGIGLLFFNGRSLFGWALTAAGALVILVGIIANLDVYFRPTSLFGTLVILTLLAAGIGLVARSLRAQGT
jgi:predicted membrane channel-forming protein YqfA (hemolysin III family)